MSTLPSNFKYIDSSHIICQASINGYSKSKSKVLPQPDGLPDHGYGASVSHGVPIYPPAYAGTHCAYPQRDGQAELIGRLVTQIDGLPVRRKSPIQVLEVE